MRNSIKLWISVLICSFGVAAAQEYIEADTLGGTGVTEVQDVIPGHTNDDQQMIEEEAIEENLDYAAFFKAVSDGDIATVQYFLSKPDIDVNKKDNNDNTALMYAAGNGHTEVVEALLENPYINVNEKNNADDQTALMRAVRNGRTEVVKALLDHPGINVNEKSYGGTAADFARFYKYPAITNLLQNYQQR